LKDSQPVLETRFQVNKAGANALKLQGAFGAKLGLIKKDEMEDKYNVQYYEMTDLEALDVFFRKCNKARNELQRYMDSMEETKAAFCEQTHIKVEDGGTIAISTEAMVYLFAAKA